MSRPYSRRIQIAPMGFEIDRVVIPAKGGTFKDRKGNKLILDKAEKVYLLIPKDPSKDKAQKYTARVQKILKAENIDTEVVRCDWENIEEITRVTRDLILKEAGNQIIVNLSGSTNHKVGLDRACMTLENRDHIHPIYVKPEKWAAPKYPKQLSTGVETITEIAIHRIINPEPPLIEALKIIKRDAKPIPDGSGGSSGMGVKKKDLAIAIYGKDTKQALTKLQRNITERLEDPWKAIKIIPAGRSDWISLTKEGKYLRYILKISEHKNNN